MTNLVVGEEVVQLEGGAHAASDLRRSLAGGQGVLFWQLARELLRSQATTTASTINHQPPIDSERTKTKAWSEIVARRSLTAWRRGFV